MHLITPNPVTDEGGPVTNSVSTYWDYKGVLRTSPANSLRLTYDPADLSKAPWPLIEPLPATNAIRNNTMFGASIGTPGTVPTNWATNPAFGISMNVVGLGAENGIDYIDIRVQGTATAAYGAAFRFDANNQIAASPDQLWACSLYCRVIGGALNGPLYPRLRAADEAGTVLANADAGAPFSPNDTPLALQRFSGVGVVASGAAYVTQMLFMSQISVGQSVDVTLRIGLPQLERDRVTSPIRTTNAAVTRAADVIGAAHGVLYSNLVESDANDAPLWLSTSAYAKDAYVRRPNHKVYRALQAIAANSIATPESNPNGSNALPLWLEWAPTKRFAAFDTTLATASSAPEVVQWIIRPGQITGALAVLAADASDARVSMVTGDGQIVYQQTKNMVLKTSRSIMDFLFKPIERRTDEVFQDLPPFKNGLIAITLTKPGSTASAGDIVAGRLVEIGDLLVEPEIRRLRRSTHKDDGYGRYKFTKRPSSKLLSCVVDVDADRADSIVSIIDKYTDEPVVIIGDDRWTSLIILGIVQDFRLSLDSETGATYNLQAEGFG